MKRNKDTSAERVKKRQKFINDEAEDSEGENSKEETEEEISLTYPDRRHVENSNLINDANDAFRGPRGTDPNVLSPEEERRINFRANFLTGELDQSKLERLSELTLKRLLDEFHTDAKTAVAEPDSTGFVKLFDVPNSGRFLTPDCITKILATFFHGVVYLMRLCRLRQIIGNETEDMIANGRRFDHIFKILRCGANRLLNDLQLKNLRDNSGSHDDVVNLFNISPPDPDQQSSWQRLLLFILNRLCERGYRRYKNACYREIQVAHCYDNDGNTFYMDYEELTSPSVAEQCYVAKLYKTHSWKRVYDIDQAVYALVDKNCDYERWLDLTSSAGNAPSTIKYLQHCVDFEFPDLEPDRLARSYRNGVVYLEPGAEAFYSFNYNASLPKNLVCCKHFDQEFDTEIWQINHWFHIKTPAFQMILADQHLDPPVQAIIYAMLGRLLYKVNQVDKWQVILFIRGVAQSGKSTIGKIAKLFFKAEDVAVMSSNIEQKFGLDPISRMLIFICFEVTKSWSLPRADFQSLISGEELSIAGKNKTARTIQWEVPGLLLGNELGPWIDAAGSMVRRLLVTEFQHRIHKGDPNLDEKLEQELPSLIFKCQQAYMATYHEFRDCSIWEKVPHYFKQVQDRIASSTNPIKEFIEKSNIVYREKDAFMPVYVFDDRFTDFARGRRYQNLHFSQDEYQHIFNEMGISTKLTTEEWDGTRFAGSFIIGLGLSLSPGAQEDNFKMEVDQKIRDDKIILDETSAFQLSLPPADLHSLTRCVCDFFPVATSNYYADSNPILISAEHPMLTSDDEAPESDDGFFDEEIEGYSMPREKTHSIMEEEQEEELIESPVSSSSSSSTYSSSSSSSSSSSPSSSSPSSSLSSSSPSSSSPSSSLSSSSPSSSLSSSSPSSSPSSSLSSSSSVFPCSSSTSYPPSTQGVTKPASPGLIQLGDIHASKRGFRMTDIL
jgi:hypothetical protein